MMVALHTIQGPHNHTCKLCCDSRPSRESRIARRVPRVASHAFSASRAAYSALRIPWRVARTTGIYRYVRVKVACHALRSAHCESRIAWHALRVKYARNTELTQNMLLFFFVVFFCLFFVFCFYPSYLSFWAFKIPPFIMYKSLHHYMLLNVVALFSWK